MAQLVNLTDFTRWLCAVSSDNASRRDWLASKTSSVGSISVNVASESFLLLSSSSSASNNACSSFNRSSFCSRHCSSCMSRWRSSSCFRWARCNILSFCRSISSRRCFAGRSSRSRWLDVLEIQEADVLDVSEADLALGVVLTTGREVFFVSGRPSKYPRAFFKVSSFSQLRCFDNFTNLFWKHRGL